MAENWVFVAVDTIALARCCEKAACTALFVPALSALLYSCCRNPPAGGLYRTVLNLVPRTGGGGLRHVV